MAFRIPAQGNKPLAAAYLDVLNSVRNTHRVANVVKQRALGTDPVNLGDILYGLLSALVECRRLMNTAKAMPGIVDYAKEQNGDPNYDVVAEFNALLGAVDACVNWIVANFPKDQNNHPKNLVLNADGTLTAATISPAALQSAGLITELDKVINAITTV